MVKEGRDLATRKRKGTQGEETHEEMPRPWSSGVFGTDAAALGTPEAAPSSPLMLLSCAKAPPDHDRRDSPSESLRPKTKLSLRPKVRRCLMRKRPRVLNNPLVVPRVDGAGAEG